MDRNTSTKAIVLNSRRSGDCDRRLSLLSEDLGLIEVTSYGARKGRKSGMAGICAEGTFFLYFNPVRQQYSLKDLLLESAHETLRADLNRNYCSLFFCELLLRMNGGDGKACVLLLSGALAALEDTLIPWSQVLIQFIWTFLSIAGLRPDLEVCPVCGKRYDGKEILGFSLPSTAPCCVKCATVPDDMLLPPGARRYLVLTASMDFVRAVRIPLNARTRTRIKRYLLRYASLAAGGGLRTLEGGILMAMESND